MTKTEKDVMKKYTRIRKIAGESTLCLCIDHQEFEVNAGEKIKWFQKMLSIAIARLIDKNRGKHDIL